MWYGVELTGGVTELYYTTSTTPGTFSTGTKVTFNTVPVEQSSVTVIKEADGFKMIAYGLDNKTFALYTSSDGLAWTKGTTVFDATTLPMDDLGKIDAPFVFNDGGTYKLYFQKKSLDGQSYKIYLATSATVGGTYALANNGNPVLSPNTDISAWDGKFVMHPWVVKDGATYYMYYSAHNSVLPQRIGLATSPDGINWTKSPANPVIGPVGEPSVIKVGNTWHMWYLGSGSAVQYVSATGPFEFQTIQAAIDAATAGNVIEVGPGTYNENITIGVPNLTLRSTGGAANTIIDANEGFGVYILKDLGTVTVDGFTVQGWQTLGIVQGTANRPGTTSKILNNIVIGETGDENHGNGIQVTGDNSIIEGNTVTGAYYTGTGPYGASGILVYAANNVVVRDNTVTGADIGISVAAGAYHSLGPITGVLVEDNEVYGTGVGIQVSFDANNTSIKDNYVHDNLTGLYEEFYLGYGPTGTVALNNRLVDNDEQALVGATDTTTIPDEHIFMTEKNWWGSIAGPGASQISEKVDFTPWCTDVACTAFAPVNGVVELSGSISVPGGILINEPGNTVIENDSPCFVIEASETIIEAEPGAKCIPTGGSNGIDVAAGLNNITIKGLEIDGSGQDTGDGIHFAGAVSNFVLADNKIHNLDGDGIEFAGAPTGVVDIAGNLFQNNTGLGINAGTFTVLANYNSWGEYSAPAIGTDISSGVDADPWTHADVALSPINEETTRVVTSLANVSGRPTVLKDGMLYHLWYGPTDTTLYHSVSTNPAEFPAGELVTFSTNTPLEVSSTAIIKEGTTFYMVAYDGTNNKAFALYSSTNGTAWTYVKQVFDGTGMADLGKIDAPFVFNDGGTYKLYFQKKSADGQRYDIYLATSATVDGTYTLHATNPVLSPSTDVAAWDGKFVMHPWVVKDGTTYYMWFSAHNGTNQRIGLATSTDGITWTKSAANPVIGPLGEPTVIKDGDIWRMWHLAGGNKINYLTALNPLDLRQTLAYQVSANLVNVNAADVTITYPADLLTIAELTSGTDLPGTFDTSVPGQISFVGYKTGAALTKQGAVLFNVTFHTKEEGTGDITLSKAEFGMPGYLSSTNVYLAAAVDTAEVEIKELPFLATDLDSSYYLTGEAQTFTVTITNQGTAYTGAVLNLTLPEGVTVTGVPATIDLDAGASQTLTLTFTSTTPGEKTIGFNLVDSLGALLFSTVETATVYDKPIITIVTDPYFIVEEPGQFTVTIENPATGRDYGNNIVFDVMIPNHVLADFGTMSCGFGATTWPVTLVTDGTGVKARILGLDTEGRFDVGAPFEPMTVTCTATLKTAGSYAPSWSMVDMTLDPTERVVQTGTGSMVAYLKPVITPTNLGGHFDAGVPETVSLSIANTAIPEPFEIVFDYPAGTVIVYGTNTYTCTSTCPVIPVDLTAEPTVLSFTVTFDEAWTGDVGVSLFDSDWTPADRLLASASATGVIVNGNFLVTGTFSMQGNASRAGIPVTLTWGGTLVPYGPTGLTTSAISNNFSLSVLYGGTYTITTNQPRYLNVYADVNFSKIITVADDYTLPALQLRGGNAIWSNNEIDLDDASKVGTDWGSTANPDGNVNFDSIVNIQDLALVGGNYGLTSATAYGTWLLP
jgi:predicted GH43/DUF377 family glycosyl hydrolase